MGIVETVHEGKDGRIRSGTVGYTIPRSKDSLGQYTGGKKVSVSRSVQRLTLLLPVEEQKESLKVVGFEVKKLGDFQFSVRLEVIGRFKCFKVMPICQ